MASPSPSLFKYGFLQEIMAYVRDVLLRMEQALQGLKGVKEEYQETLNYLSNLEKEYSDLKRKSQLEKLTGDEQQRLKVVEDTIPWVKQQLRDLGIEKFLDETNNTINEKKQELNAFKQKLSLQDQVKVQTLESQMKNQ